MASQAALLSNHYDVLGLPPTASQEEIGGAFAAALSQFGPQPLTAKLPLYAAFEVLRQPEKRKAYDRSIGLAPAEPEPARFVVPQQARVSFAVAAQGKDTIRPAMRAFDEPLRLPPEIPAPASRTEPAPQEIARPVPEPIAEVRPDSIAEVRPDPIAEVRSEPVAEIRPEPIEEVRPDPVDQRPKSREATNEVELYQLVERIRADGHARKESMRFTERRPQDWRRVGIAAAALIAGAGLFGGIVGFSADSSSAPEDALDSTLPAPSPYLAGSAPTRDFDKEAEAQVRAENEAAGKRQLAAANADRRITPLTLPPEMEAAPANTPPPVAAAVAPAAAEQTKVAANAADPLAPEPEVAAPVSTAKMPLPNATISRTIEKIGYPCGSVSSIAAVDAGGGVFKVSCSSGHSYRAAPTGGRYRFKKWGGA